METHLQSDYVISLYFFLFLLVLINCFCYQFNYINYLFKADVCQAQTISGSAPELKTHLIIVSSKYS